MSWLIGKDSDVGKHWGQEENWVTEHEMVAWHHWLNGQEFDHTLGDSEGYWSLACCSLWGHKEPDINDWLNNNNLTHKIAIKFLSEILANRNYIKTTKSHNQESCSRNAKLVQHSKFIFIRNYIFSVINFLKRVNIQEHRIIAKGEKKACVNVQYSFVI